MPALEGTGLCRVCLCLKNKQKRRWSKQERKNENVDDTRIACVVVFEWEMSSTRACVCTLGLRQWYCFVSVWNRWDTESDWRGRPLEDSLESNIHLWFLFLPPDGYNVTRHLLLLPPRLLPHHAGWTWWDRIKISSLFLKKKRFILLMFYL